MKHFFVGIGMIVLCMLGLLRLDHFFFKHNSRFCLRHIYSTLPYNPDWDIPPLTASEKEDIDQILDQKFYYLHKGGQAFAFVSEDEKYVIKFCRFPSPLRPLSWIKNPLSKIKSVNAQKTKKNLIRLHNSFHSYKLAYQDLKTETSLLYLHLNRSHDLHKTITLIDKLGHHYKVALDNLSFILQKKAELFYPTLRTYQAHQNWVKAHLAIQSIVELFTFSAQKGIIDNDSILHKNYGFIDGKAMLIDLGDLTRDESIKNPKRCLDYVLKATTTLKQRLQDWYPEFLPFYEDNIQKLHQNLSEDAISSYEK